MTPRLLPLSIHTGKSRDGAYSTQKGAVSGAGLQKNVDAAEVGSHQPNTPSMAVGGLPGPSALLNESVPGGERAPLHSMLKSDTRSLAHQPLQACFEVM